MAQEAEAIILQQAIRRSIQPAYTLTACGCCHNCSASVPAGSTFCDVDCRDDWSRRNPSPPRAA